MPQSCPQPPHPSLTIPRTVSLAVAMSSRVPPLPRLALATAVSVVAVALEVLRRRRRGPILHDAPLADEVPHVVSFGRGHCPEYTGDPSDLMDPPVNRDDPLFWLRELETKREKVLHHLSDENAFTNFKTLPRRRLRDVLYKELLSHYVETDAGVPAPLGDYAYYTKTLAGRSFRFYCRKPLRPDGSLGDEQILLDVNVLAASLKHCEVSTCEVSPDGRLLAYSIDSSGYETYEIRFVDLASGNVLTDRAIAATSGSFNWGVDSNSIFYQTMDDAHRPYKLWRRDLTLTEDDSATGKVRDLCLYTENDSEYYMYATKSRSGRFLFIGSDASMTSEHRFIDLETGSDDLSVQLIRERSSGVLYDISHAGGDQFYIVANTEGADNFKVMRADVKKPAEWTSFLPYDELLKIDHVSCFESFGVVIGRQGGYSQMWVLPDHDVSKMYCVQTEDDAHSLMTSHNLEFGAKSYRYAYASLTAPKREYELDVVTGVSTLLKEQAVPGYDYSLYATERIEAVSKDGTRVPMSLVYKRGATGDGDGDGDGNGDGAVVGERRVLLYGYGSYEISMEPSFAMTRLPLLDRGVVFAIAHVRGGGEFGRLWYEAARLEDKKKTFEDFVACAEHLVDTGRTRAQWLGIEGRSAGGLLVGAVLNMRPELFRAAVAGVPFVDVVNTMSDASIPLTTGEWQEWGNPHVRKYFDAISAYCPYSNVREVEYPAVLVLAGLYDPRVMYSEPAKWVAKLRKLGSGDKDILLKVDLSSGHFSASNRYHYLKEKAFELSWLLHELDAESRM